MLNVGKTYNFKIIVPVFDKINYSGVKVVSITDSDGIREYIPDPVSWFNKLLDVLPVEWRKVNILHSTFYIVRSEAGLKYAIPDMLIEGTSLEEVEKLKSTLTFEFQNEAEKNQLLSLLSKNGFRYTLQ